MPIYEYKCEKCNTKFEVIRPMKDADTAIACKSCNSTRTKRALSLCYSKSDGGSSASSSASSCSGGGCGGCSGGSCGSCNH